MCSGSEYVSALWFGGLFVKISKEGKRHDNVRKGYEEKCPLTASESEELLSSNHIK